MNKYVLSLISACILSSSVYASDVLYKNLKAGEKITKTFKEKELKEKEFDCGIIELPLKEISQCYLISEKESIGREKDFMYIVSTINNKINTVHLMKKDSAGSLASNTYFWDIMFKSGLKGYDSFDNNEDLKMTSNLMNNLEFSALQNKIYANALLQNQGGSFRIDNLLLDTKLNVGENFDFIKVIGSEPQNINRMVEILDSFDSESQTWTYRIDIMNPYKQKELEEEYNKLHPVADEKI